MENKPTLAEVLALAENAPDEKDPNYEVNKILAVQYDGSDESADAIASLMLDDTEVQVVGDTLILSDDDGEIEIDIGEWFVLSLRNGITVVPDITLGRTL
jgi:hypothetical protein